MPLAPFRDFFIACVGASASFIGLLFVALSVVLARMEGDTKLEFSDRRLAESAFTALVNVFFVCLIALLPGANVDYSAFIMAIIGLRSSWVLFKRLKRNQDAEIPLHREREIYWISASVFFYILQGVYAVRIFLQPTNVSNLYMMMTILLVLFGAGLFRSWELTGVRGK